MRRQRARKRKTPAACRPCRSAPHLAMTGHIRIIVGINRERTRCSGQHNEPIVRCCCANCPPSPPLRGRSGQPLPMARPEAAGVTAEGFRGVGLPRRNPGRLVSLDEILDEVWPDRFVQPEIVKTHIRTLRRLREDDVRRPRFIETRPRSGYRFVGELPDRQEAQPPSTPCLLLGRSNERAAIKRALDKARTGKREYVVVTGEAGLGKSALLDAAASGVRLEPDVVVATSYGVTTRGFREPPGLSIALLQDLARQFDPSVLTAALAAHAPHWARYLAPGPEASLDEPQRGWWLQQMAREACALVECLATHSTILLAVDDLQWADPDTSDLLVSLASRRYPAHLLVVTTFRQIQFTAPCPIRAAVHGLIRQGRAQELALPPLDYSERIAVLQQSVDEAAKCRELAMESGGNPRLLQTLAAFANDAGGDVARPANTTKLMSQVDDIPPAMQQVLEAGSIAGPRFCAWAVAKILGAEQDLVEDLLSRGPRGSVCCPRRSRGRRDMGGWCPDLRIGRNPALIPTRRRPFGTPCPARITTSGALPRLNCSRQMTRCLT